MPCSMRVWLCPAPCKSQSPDTSQSPVSFEWVCSVTLTHVPPWSGPSTAKTAKPVRGRSARQAQVHNASMDSFALLESAVTRIYQALSENLSCV